MCAVVNRVANWLIEGSNVCCCEQGCALRGLIKTRYFVTSQPATRLQELSFYVQVKCATFLVHVLPYSSSNNIFSPFV
jgi:hypothetical protein